LPMERAVFIGWQRAPGWEPAALYTVMDPDSSIYHSTVSAETLKQHGIPVPVTPSPVNP
jgi:hypothetical protein